MRFSSNINNVKAKEWKLNLNQAYLFSWIYELPSWANKVVIGSDCFYFASRNKAIEELPILTDKPDTIYRYYRQLENLNLIYTMKIDGKDYLALTDKGKTWNEFKKDGFQSEDSETNPNEVGNESENNSDLNPTYNNTILDNNTKDKLIVCDAEIYPSFEDFWNEYDKKVGLKEKVKKKWNELSQNVKEQIMDYIPKYKISQPSKKYRKNPETFLNNKSWEDEIIFESNTTSSSGKVGRQTHDEIKNTYESFLRN